MTSASQVLEDGDEDLVHAVEHRRLAVEDPCPCRLDSVASVTAELDRDDRIVGSVADGHRKPVAAGEVELEALDGQSRRIPARPGRLTTVPAVKLSMIRTAPVEPR
jgi:hypothetical protein